MSKIKWPGSVLLAPVPPVLVTCGQAETSNVLTVGWTGILNTKPPMTYISLRPTRLSYEIISEAREFTINLSTVDLVKAVDFCGVRSGREVNKLEQMALEINPGDLIKSPMLAASPLSMECRVKEIIPLGTHDMFMSEILAVHVSEELLDANGKLHLDKAGLLAYVHGEYFGLGKKYGTFGYTVRKKRKKKK
ncbi:flavin reductase family protein [Acetobacterium fimetarium]|uniref:Flavin reductase family protein n=1 Tax=Acetobacterium fimetarium TaxID=52691 RepID=A0ABR6WRT2_9FIRM|nr:flavin reductase family protein [Acetobacterium fimetarium]MBC3803228.1 flavin reductase family protein [Acetobacterium fimetarium]